ncbi:hypothetical protein [Polymorphum gilvum]|uniref:Uncharacterized protein n=1 Tax=Polymorphum gilvum (strain LMG 25793 / CGMCC 1.9160 / SL003B-26A1) TaxID=991905 RepID=F2J3T5_POLGS|nr:hypothetical protein [Polymorphum gilvum]ADZ68917.1 hypothetical protein SL003B_0482 [Polymorphum gilvum SL003B-26A1]
MVEMKLKKPRPRGLPLPPERPIVGNLHKPAGAGKVPLQLKLSPEVRRDFRTYAAARDLELSELFCLVWEDFKRAKG